MRTTLNSLALISLLCAALAIALPGCQPPDGKTKTPKKSPAVKTETGKKTEAAEPKTVEVKTEEPAKTEAPAVKTEEAKPEEPAKTEEKKPEMKTEEPAAKTEEAKPEVKPEPKTEEPAKTAETKPETKTEEPAAKTEEAKPEEPAKTAETKPETKTEEPVAKADGSEPPAPPKVSTFAPAKDLVEQADKYVKDLEKATSDETTFKEETEAKAITRDAELLALAALALGLSDEDSKYKAPAAAVYEAAHKLAAAKDFAAAKEAMAAVKDAAEGKGKSTLELKWALAPESEKMWPATESIKMKIPATAAKFKSKGKTAPGNTAMLAVIAQAAMVKPVAKPADLLKTPEDYKKWYDFCAQMRDAAAAVNAAAHAEDGEAVVANKDKLDKTCNDCHDVFRKEDAAKN